MSKNHTRQAITHEERYQLQQYKESHKSATQEQCAEWFFKTYGKKISQSTVSDSLNSRRHRATPITDVRNPARSRDGKPKWPKLETPLYERARFEIEHGRPVTKPSLAKWATEMFPIIYPDVQPVPSFSIGMMARFADRNGILTTSSKEKHPGSTSANMGMPSVLQSTQNFHQSHVKEHKYGNQVANSPELQLFRPGASFIVSDSKSMDFQGGASMTPLGQFPVNKDHGYDKSIQNQYPTSQISPQYAYPPVCSSSNALSHGISISASGNTVTVTNSDMMSGSMVPVLPNAQAAAVSSTFFKSESVQTATTSPISPIAPGTYQSYPGIPNSDLQYSQQLPQQFTHISNQNLQSAGIPGNETQVFMPAQFSDNSQSPVYVSYDQNYPYMQYPQQQQPFPIQYSYRDMIPVSSHVRQSSDLSGEQIQLLSTNPSINISDGIFQLQPVPNTHLQRSSSKHHKHRHRK